MNVLKFTQDNKNGDMSRSLTRQNMQLEFHPFAARWAPNLAILTPLEIPRRTTSCLDLISVATPNVSPAAIAETSKEENIKVLKESLHSFGDIGRNLWTFLSPNLWDLSKRRGAG